MGQAHKSAIARYLRASFADNVQFSSSLDDFAGVTQFLDGRAHTHRVVGASELTRAAACVKQPVTQGRCWRVQAELIDFLNESRERPETKRCAQSEALSR